MTDLGALAREIIDASLYMVLGTADETGTPWACPVYFAHADYRRFFWVSNPDAQHSQNIETRREISLVIFDSGAAINTGQAVYMSAQAGRPAGTDTAADVEIFSRRAVAHGGRSWSAEEFSAPGWLRLYHARAMNHYVLDERDHRVPVHP
ncbi:MAG TPA: pyridoxamine 5'-phosphate oxidase family protein [Solirubrobacteraceae bacterium]